MIMKIQQTTGASIRKVCQVLDLPRSSFYRAAKPSIRERFDEQIADQIGVIFKEHRSRYGHRRIWRHLADEGTTCSPRRIRRIMKESGLRAIQPKSFIPKTSDGKAAKPSPNLLTNRPLPSLPSQVWTADITHVPTSKGWLYLAVVMDLCSRKILGWKLANHMRSQLVIEAFDQAIASTSRRGTAPIFHSDRGSQYGSHAFRAVLKNAGFSQSMSARSNPYDNAWTESFFATLKREMLQNGIFEGLEDANIEIFDYIHGYYNTHRIHSALGYCTPALFEKNALHLSKIQTPPKDAGVQGGRVESPFLIN
jgi:putative transposase